jgi:hypothetical protein
LLYKKLLHRRYPLVFFSDQFTYPNSVVPKHIRRIFGRRRLDVAGVHPEGAPKGPPEPGGLAIADCPCCRSHGEAVLLATEESARRLHSDIEEVIPEGLAGLLGKHPLQLPRRAVDLLRNVLQAQIEL